MGYAVSMMGLRVFPDNGICLKFREGRTPSKAFVSVYGYKIAIKATIMHGYDFGVSTVAL